MVQRFAACKAKRKINMKLSVLAITAMALTAVCGGPALAQAIAPVTMQPVANPPEKPMAAHGHKGWRHAKHHAKAEAKAAPDTAASAK